MLSAVRNQCRGNIVTDEASARKSCAPPPALGYCCAGGEISRANREQCRGSFFTDQASARKACVAPPEQGYCCADGKVSQSTRAACSGIFARAQEEAQRACKATVPAIPKSDVLKEIPKREIPKAPDGPVVR